MSFSGMSFYSLIGALVFLVFGMIELAVIYRVVYPQLRWRFEKAKTTQSQGLDPNRLMMVFKVQSLIVMPLIGLLLGNRLKDIFG